MQYNFEGQLTKDASPKNSSILYIVATPIGHLEDITYRAVTILQKVDVILAEDTRHSGQLLARWNIKKPLTPLHEHNERAQIEPLIQRLKNGESMALISDAGTPLISDPGFNLVRSAQEHGIKVVPIPGPSALITALSASGLPTDSFVFQGFLPAKKGDRQKALEALLFETRSLIFYEAPHRLLATLQDMLTVFGAAREAVLARELTKTFETIQRLPLAELLEWSQTTDQARGEIVLLVAGNKTETPSQGEVETRRLLKILLSELPVKQVAALAAKITGQHKRDLYQLALTLKGSPE